MTVAMVTGSSSGIGKATALELARQGHSLILHARSNIRGLQETAAQIQDKHQQQVLCLTADISCPQACRKLVSAAFAWQGTMDVWVNNAGADVLKPSARNLDFEQKLALLLNVDVAGTIRLSRIVAKRMAQLENPSRKLLVNIGWDQAELGMENDPGQLFCTTKAAVQAFTRSLSLSFPIRVNCVAPGWIKTSWGESSASDYWDFRAQKEAIQNRWGMPEDIAKTIAWLASTDSQFVNGTTINVNGGRRFWPEPPQ